MDDKIALTSEPIPSDVADRIQKTFRRRAIIDDSLITVSNNTNTIYLDGKVDSWTAREAADDAAWERPASTTWSTASKWSPEPRTSSSGPAASRSARARSVRTWWGLTWTRTSNRRAPSPG